MRLPPTPSRVLPCDVTGRTARLTATCRAACIQRHSNQSEPASSAAPSPPLARRRGRCGAPAAAVAALAPAPAWRRRLYRRRGAGAGVAWRCAWRSSDLGCLLIADRGSCRGGASNRIPDGAARAGGGGEARAGLASALARAASNPKLGSQPYGGSLEEMPPAA
eukprot:363978-Chlamydomonas_euryale.AAC.11